MRQVVLLATAIVVAFILASVGIADVRPLAVSNGAVGGGPLNQYTLGVENGKGLNNIGLLIRTWGKVTHVDTTGKYFYIDDGTGRTDGSLNIGLRVSYDNLATGNSIQVPAQGAFVLVTGISTTWELSGKYWPNIRPRHDPDVQILLP